MISGGARGWLAGAKAPPNMAKVINLPAAVQLVQIVLAQINMQIWYGTLIN